MYAIIKVGARQEKVKVGDTFDMSRTTKKKEVSFDKVLMTISGKDAVIGTPYIKGMKVVCDVIADKKGKKKIAFKFKRRKSYKRKIGHRDLLTTVKVKEIK
jgi:large subunit ribosomal protein L21